MTPKVATNYSPPPAELALLSTKYNLTEKTITKILASFNSFDLDGDGCITAAELKTIVDLLGREVPQEEIQKMVQNIDKNADNMIQFDEYVEILAPNVGEILLSFDPKTNSFGQPQTTGASTTQFSGAAAAEMKPKLRKVSTGSLGASSSGISTRGSCSVQGPLTGVHTPLLSNLNNQATPQPQQPSQVNFPQLSSRDLFNIYDRDRNGYISKDEVETVMQYLGESLSKQDLDEMMFGKEEIDYNDFVNLLENTSNPSLGEGSHRASVSNPVENVTMMKDLSGSRPTANVPIQVAGLEPGDQNNSRARSQDYDNVSVASLFIEEVTVERKDLAIPNFSYRPPEEKVKRKKKSKCTVM